MAGTLASIKDRALSIWNTKTGLIGCVVFAWGVLATAGNAVRAVSDVATYWDAIRDWSPAALFFFAGVAFFRASAEAKEHADKKAAETQALIASFEEKVSAASETELQELRRWHILATEVADIARLYRLLSALRAQRERLLLIFQYCERFIRDGNPALIGRQYRREIGPIHAAIREVAELAKRLDPTARHSIGAIPLDSDINAANPDNEQNLPPDLVTDWRTTWLRANRALDGAAAIARTVDEDLAKREVALTQNVART